MAETNNMEIDQPATDLEFTSVTEGKATILFPKSEDVFYNPIQQFNRDLSVLGIRAWSELYHQYPKRKKRSRSEKYDGKNKKPATAEDSEQAKSQAKIADIGTNQGESKQGDAEPEPVEVQEDAKTNEVPPFSILEALLATGLRAIRYAKEIPGVQKIIANDLLPKAVDSIDRNIEHNKVEEIVQSHCGDANWAMRRPDLPRVQVVDLDPYGLAAPFLDAAVQAIGSDGLLLVTCTDLAVLAGNGYPEKCYALYGGTNLKGDATHESALRLVIGLVAALAARYKKCVEPLLSLSIDYYVRVFLRVRTSPKAVKELMGKLMSCYVCLGCGLVHTQPMGRSNGNGKYSWAQGPTVPEQCSFCGFVHHICGPMWAGPLHDKAFCDRVLTLEDSADEAVYKTKARIKGMVTLAKHELETPFYFAPSRVLSVLRIACPPITVLVAGISSKGYKVSLSHAAQGAIKTDAPYSVVLEVFKNYIREKKLVSDEQMAKMSVTAAGYKILKNESIPDNSGVLFEPNEGSKEIERLRRVKIVRYQMNPRSGWGPMAKAK